MHLYSPKAYMLLSGKASSFLIKIPMILRLLKDFRELHLLGLLKFLYLRRKTTGTQIQEVSPPRASPIHQDQLQGSYSFTVSFLYFKKNKVCI
nr:hypothetical protein Iba_chr04cCG14770 [Ipomoea batatas]GMC90871.1 hypothetical protein Iba_chr04fCG12210 [Ipomoea batatas]